MRQEQGEEADRTHDNKSRERAVDSTREEMSKQRGQSNKGRKKNRG